MSTRREARSNGRSVIKRIMPRQNEQVNEIWICDKGRFVHHFADSPERLTQPLIRRNGELVEASWDEALDHVAGKLQQHKGAVAGLSGGRLSNEDYFQFQKLFRDGLKSNNLDLARRRLAGGEVVAKVGISSDSNLLDLGEGDAILVTASDLHEEAPVWWFRVKQATERGAKLVVLNLRPTRLDQYAAHAIHYPLGEALDRPPVGQSGQSGNGNGRIQSPGRRCRNPDYGQQSGRFLRQRRADLRQTGTLARCTGQPAAD
jgi:NADH-quinone oxidoreductase subunit G